MKMNRPHPLTRSILAAVALSLTGGAHGAFDTWVGDTSANWNDLNWTGGNNPPIDGDSFSFDVAGTSGTVLNNDLAPLFTTLGIDFTFLADSYVISGNAVTLAGNITNSSALLQTINFDIELPGTQLFTTSDFGGDLSVGGVLSGLGTVAKNAPGTLFLTNTASTYTGETIFGDGLVNPGGIVNVASIADYGVPSSLGARTEADENNTLTGISLHFQGGTLQYTGATAQSTNREIRILNGNGATIDASGLTPDATLSFTHTGANINLFDTPGARTLTLTGTNTGNNSFSIQITDQAANKTSLQKTGFGTWVIPNSDNTYRGETIFGGGILNVASVSDYGVDSSIGGRTLADENTTVTGVSLHFQGGTLQYTGSTPQSTNRNVRILNGDGGTIDASGSTPEATLSFTHTGSNINLFDTPGDRTFRLTGTNTGDNSFSIVLANQQGSPTGLIKEGSGRWVLNGPDTNTATGATQVNAGTLVLGKSNAVAVSGPLNIGDGLIPAVVILSGAGGNQIADASVVSLSGIGGSASILRLNGMNETVGGVSSFDGGIVENESGVAGTATLTVSIPDGGFQNYAGVFRDGDGADVDGTLGFTKTGAGSFTISGASSHTGATTVSGGILTVDGSLPAGSAVSVTNARVDGAGTIMGPVTLGNGGVLASTGTVGGTIAISNGGTLAGTSTVNNLVTAASGGSISPGGPAAPGALAISSLTLGAGSIIDFEPGPGGDAINITMPSGLTINGGGFNILDPDGITPFVTNGSYTLLDYNTSFAGALSNLTILNSQVGKLYNIINDAAGTLIKLSIDDATVTEWNGGAGDNLWTSVGNWTAGVPNGPGAVATFGTMATPTAISVNGPQTVGGILFNNANSYSVTGTDTITLDNGVAAASISILSGNHTVAAPLVLVSSVNATTESGTTLTISGAISGSAGLIASGSGTTVLTGANSYGATTVNGGTLQVGDGGTTGSLGTGDITIGNGGTLVLNRSDAVTVAANIFGNNGILTKAGAGNLILSGANTFATSAPGVFNINGGTVQLGSANALASGVRLALAGGSLDLNTNSVTSGLLDGTAGSISDGGSGAGTSTLTINQAETTTFAGTILDGATRTVAVTKSGLGALTLTGNNTFTGPLKITGGAIIAAGSGGDVPIISNVTFGDGSDEVFLIAGVLDQQFGAGTVITFDNGARNAKFQLRGSDQTVAGLDSMGDDGVSLAIIQNDEAGTPGYVGDPGLATLTIHTTSDHNFAGLIRNNAGGGLNLVKEGPATQVIRNILVATDDFGAVTVNEGTLAFNFMPNGIQTNNLVAASSFLVNSGGTLAFEGIINVASSIDGDGTIVVRGTGTDATLSGFNTFTSGIRLDDGTLGIAGDQALGDPASTVEINGGIIRAVNAGREVPNPILVNDSFTLGRLTNLNGGITLTADATITASNFDGPANNNSNLSAVTGNFRLTLAEGVPGIGTGALVINDINTNGGGTTVTSGRVTVSALGALANADLTVDGGELNFDNLEQTVTALSGIGGTMNINFGTLTVDQVVNTVFAGALGSGGALMKTGAGSLTLSGDSSGFFGAVNAAGGNLLVSGNLSGSVMTVSGGTLGGTGTVGMTMLESGTIAPGETIGILNTGSLTLNGGTVAFALDGVIAGVDYDQLSVTGEINFTGDVQLSLQLGTTFSGGETFVLFNNDGTDPVNTSGGLLAIGANPLSEGEQFFLSGQPFTISYVGGEDGNDIVLVSVPEPSCALMLAGFFGGVLGLSRHRRQRG